MLVNNGRSCFYYISLLYSWWESSIKGTDLAPFKFTLEKCTQLKSTESWSMTNTAGLKDCRFFHYNCQAAVSKISVRMKVPG